jgi:hypothetical protein
MFPIGQKAGGDNVSGRAGKLIVTAYNEGRSDCLGVPLAD